MGNPANKAIGSGGSQPSQKVCSTCHGRKTVTVKSATMGGTTTREIPCPTCAGKGFGSGMMTK